MVFLGVLAIPLLTNPSLHIDEGYYLGASRAILDGDLLLRGYGFDKPFLIALWPIPGILLLGKQALGFRLMALLAYLTSFVVFYQTLRKVLEGRLLALLVAGLLFLTPTFFVHGVSNFCEPYLILCAVLILYGVGRGATDAFLSRVFFLGVFTKFSFVLYLPLLLPRIRKSGIRAFLKPAFPILGLAVLYMISNPIKFGSVTWFTHFVSDQHTESFWVRVLHRASDVFHSLDSVTLTTLLMLAISGWWIWKRPALRSDESLLPAVVGAHLFIFLFMGAKFYPRYVVQSLPAVFLLAAQGLALFRGTGVRARLLEPALIFGLLSLLISIGGHPRTPVDEDRVLGRELHLYGTEANHEGAWVQNAYLWQSAPFGGRARDDGCLTPGCEQAVRTAHPWFENAYVFSDQKLKRGPLYTGSGSRVKREEVPHRESAKTIAQNLLRALRLGRTYEVESLVIEPASNRDSGAWFMESGVRLKAKPKPGKSVPLPPIELRFRVGVHEFHQGRAFPKPIYTLLARVDELKIGSAELTDLILPLFFEGYVLPLGNLPYEYDRAVRYTPLDLGPEGLKLLKETVKPFSE